MGYCLYKEEGKKPGTAISTINVIRWLRKSLDKVIGAHKYRIITEVI